MVTARTRLVVLAMVVAAAGVALPTVTARPDTPRTTTAGSNASAGAPGAQLAGAIGAQGADVHGDVDRRAFDVAFASIHSNESRAQFIANRATALRDRVSTLTKRRAALVAAHRNGTLGDNAFTARMATLAARSRALSDLANRSADRAEHIPTNVRRRHGVDPGALRAVGARAHDNANLSTVPAANAVENGGKAVQFGPLGPPSTTANHTPQGDAHRATPTGRRRRGVSVIW